MATSPDVHPSASPVHAAGVAPSRIGSVDALRGFAMFWIVGGDSIAQALKKVSAGGHGPLAATGAFLGEQLDHAAWAGFHFYDLVFPLFLFIVGVSLVYSLPAAVAREGTAATHRRVLRRFVLLYVLGILYYGGAANEWPGVRLVGVLNRIALCYLAAALLFMHCGRRSLIATCVGLLAGYWALLTFVPVPGHGAGSYAEGANLANWIDSRFLPGKRWDGAWDPEGLLSTLPAIATCLLGVLAGQLLRREDLGSRAKTRWLIGGGLALLAAGLLWSVQFPLVKKIWTSSFVLVAGGWSAILLGAFYHAIDVRGVRGWTAPLVWIGGNAIALYFADKIFNWEVLAGRLVGGDIAKFLDARLAVGAGHLVQALVGLLLAVAFAGYLYRKKHFIRV